MGYGVGDWGGQQHKLFPAYHNQYCLLLSCEKKNPSLALFFVGDSQNWVAIGFQDGSFSYYLDFM